MDHELAVQSFSLQTLIFLVRSVTALQFQQRPWVHVNYIDTKRQTSLFGIFFNRCFLFCFCILLPFLPFLLVLFWLPTLATPPFPLFLLVLFLFRFLSELLELLLLDSSDSLSLPAALSLILNMSVTKFSSS